MPKEKITSPNRSELKALIDSIGGEAALIRILEGFYAVMAKDPMIGYFFEGKPLHSIAGKQAEFILMAAGISRDFRGNGPASAHTAMPPIFSGHFDRRLVLLRQCLTHEGLTPAQIDTWMRFEESFRAVVVARD